MSFLKLCRSQPAKFVQTSMSRAKVRAAGEERPWTMIFDCDEIVEGRLWIGSYIDAESVRSLRPLGITAVLSLQSDRDLEEYNIQWAKLLNAYELAGIQIHRVPIPDFDRQALSANLSRGVAELETALNLPGSKVYVHCTAGINRGPAVAAAYLIKTRGLSAREAYDYVTARRSCNPYLDCLEAYEASFKSGQARQTS